MGLRIEAEAALEEIIENTDDFGWPMTLYNPSGESLPVVGLNFDVSQLIDPQTGLVVAGRTATASLRISTLLAAGFDIPEGIADRTVKPWRIEVTDINANEYNLKVKESQPDRTLGLVTLVLETYA